MLLLLFACTSDPVGRDASAEDGGTKDVYTPPDAGPPVIPDAGRVDAGKPDAAFLDPDTIQLGSEMVEGLRTYFHLQGTVTSTLPPLFVLHDGPGLSHEYLVPFLKPVVPGRLVVFYDMRASGQTSFGDLSGTSTLTAAAHAKDLGKVLEHARRWGVDTDRVDLYGHGYGAAIASLFAAAEPGRVDRMLLVTPYPATIDQWVTSRGEFERRMSSSERELWTQIVNRPECLRNDSRCFLQVLEVVGPNAMCRENEAQWSELPFEYGSFRALMFVETQLRDSRYDWRGELAKIRADVTVVAGACDSIPAETATTYATAIPGAELVALPTSGHYPMVEDPDAHARALRRALSRP